MKVRCINDGYMKSRLTVGKLYEVFKKVTNGNENYYYIIDDCGNCRIGYNQKILEEVRMVEIILKDPEEGCKCLEGRTMYLNDVAIFTCYSCKGQYIKVH